MLIAFMFFIILASCVQIVAFRTYKQESRWLLTDYFWLTVASSALIFYGMKAVQVENAAHLRTWEQMMAEYDSGSLHSMGTISLGLYIMYDQPPGVEPVPEDAKMQEARELDSRINASMQQIEKEGMDKFLYVYSHDAMAEGITSPEVVQKLEEFEKELVRIRERYKEVKGLKYSSLSSLSAALEYHLYPYLLAIALALRLGRTTADYLRKTR